jgi:hypothetical protein
MGQLIAVLPTIPVKRKMSSTASANQNPQKHAELLRHLIQIVSVIVRVNVPQTVYQLIRSVVEKVTLVQIVAAQQEIVVRNLMSIILNADHSR